MFVSDIPDLQVSGRSTISVVSEFLMPNLCLSDDSCPHKCYLDVESFCSVFVIKAVRKFVVFFCFLFAFSYNCFFLQLCTLWYRRPSSTSRTGHKGRWGIPKYPWRGKFSDLVNGRTLTLFSLFLWATAIAITVIIWIFQTEKVRQEHSEDMSILQAFSIVLDRRPDLRFRRFIAYSMTVVIYFFFPAEVHMLFSLH